MVVKSSIPLQDITFSYHRSISEKYGEGVAKLCHKVLFYCNLNKGKGGDATVYLSARKLGECLGRSTRSIRMYFAAARKAELITTKKYYKDGFLVGNLVTPTEKLVALGLTTDLMSKGAGNPAFSCSCRPCDGQIEGFPDPGTRS